jgi:hypothetical protein
MAGVMAHARISNIWQLVHSVRVAVAVFRIAKGHRLELNASDC